MLFREVLTVGEGVCERRFKNCDMGNVFASGARTCEDTGKWIVPFDSARRIGVYTLLNEVLTVGEGLCGRCFKKCDI